jgi:hypothetical protein
VRAGEKYEKILAAFDHACADVGGEGVAQVSLLLPAANMHLYACPLAPSQSENELMYVETDLYFWNAGRNRIFRGCKLKLTRGTVAQRRRQFTRVPAVF